MISVTGPGSTIWSRGIPLGLLCSLSLLLAWAVLPKIQPSMDLSREISAEHSLGRSPNLKFGRIKSADKREMENEYVHKGLLSATTSAAATAELLLLMQQALPVPRSNTSYRAFLPEEAYAPYCRVAVDVTSTMSADGVEHFLNAIRHTVPRIWIEKLSISVATAQLPREAGSLLMTSRAYGFRSCFNADKPI